MPKTAPRRSADLPSVRGVRAWLALLVLVCAACERPFIAESPPAIEVLAPDAREVLLDDAAPLRVRVTSFRSVARVTLDGQPLERLEGDVWGDTLRVRRGVTAHVLQAFDTEGLEGRDTLRVVHLPFAVTSGPSLPLTARGGHTATLLTNGLLLVVGGTPAIDEPALASAVLLTPGGGGDAVLPDALNAARTGHSATLLPDGRVLILGGARRDSVRTRTDLVETVEVYDPVRARFDVVPFAGTPIRRAFHAAVLRPGPGDPIVDLYSGWTASNDGRPFGRSDVRSFVLRDDTLFARSAVFGLDDTAPGLTAVSLPAAAGGARILLAGSYFARGVSSTVNLVVAYEPGGAIGVEEVGPLHRPRTRHAAALLGTPAAAELAFVAGGRGEAPREPFASPEVFSDAQGGFFRYPSLPAEREALLRRFGHTATFLSSGRILLVGGYTSSGNGTRSTAYITFFE